MSVWKREKVQTVLWAQSIKIKRSYSKDVSPSDETPRITNRFKKNGGAILHDEYDIKVVNAMVELDQMKQELQTYESPLAEVRDSL